MKYFATSFGDLMRGVVSIGLIATAMGIVAPRSLLAAIGLVVIGVALAATGASRPILKQDS
jgi:hypothetical protein